MASHLALDLTNVYGVRLLLPFSPRWLRLDIFSVIDPWIWGCLLPGGDRSGAVKAHRFGDRRALRPSRAPAIFALSFLLVYGCARVIIHERALAIIDSRIYDGSPPRRVAAFPSAYNPFAWRGLVEGASFYSLVDVNVLKYSILPTAAYSISRRKATPFAWPARPRSFAIFSPSLNSPSGQ